MYVIIMKGIKLPGTYILLYVPSVRFALNITSIEFF